MANRLRAWLSLGRTWNIKARRGRLTAPATVRSLLAMSAFPTTLVILYETSSSQGPPAFLSFLRCSTNDLFLWCAAMAGSYNWFAYEFWRFVEIAYGDNRCVDFDRQRRAQNGVIRHASEDISL